MKKKEIEGCLISEQRLPLKDVLFDFVRQPGPRADSQDKDRYGVWILSVLLPTKAGFIVFVCNGGGSSVVGGCSSKIPVLFCGFFKLFKMQRLSLLSCDKFMSPPSVDPTNVGMK